MQHGEKMIMELFHIFIQLLRVKQIGLMNLKEQQMLGILIVIIILDRILV